ncbi:response regulator transcription factor [Hamadaea sp.]|uniref:response regulator n=1 Tax=Hamadaea sp. TaxID=2024425 RepID=UPI0025BB69C4|nr:response regulator transcription factor [Hamadaea sp.]
MIRVLVVEDQVLIRGGLVALIKTAPELSVVGDASDGEQAVELAASTNPDVVLMDLRMPGVDGIEATRRILAAAGETPPRVLVLTTYDHDEYVYRALLAGASGYLLKDTTPERLLNAITTVAYGGMLFDPTVVRSLIDAYAPTPSQNPAQLRTLTSRETEILRLIAHGLSNGDISDRLEITDATVKTHVNRVLAKLGLASRAEAVILAYEAGLVVPRRSRGEAPDA